MVRIHVDYERLDGARLNGRLCPISLQDDSTGTVSLPGKPQSAVIPHSLIGRPTDQRIRREAALGDHVLLRPEHPWAAALSRPVEGVALSQCMHDHRPGHRGGWSSQQGCQVLFDPGEAASIQFLGARISHRRC